MIIEIDGKLHIVELDDDFVEIRTEENSLCLSEVKASD